MIDPRQSPVAMLPILNAVAGHMIADTAPLRKINVEDTEQMICEACDAGGFDCDDMDASLHRHMAHLGSFFNETKHLSQIKYYHGTLDAFMDTLRAVIEESV